MWVLLQALRGSRLQAVHLFALWALVLALLYRELVRDSPRRPAEGRGSGCARLLPHAVHYSRRVVLPQGVAPAFVHVDEFGTIATVSAANRSTAAAFAARRGAALHDHGTSVLGPGLIDVHVHISALGGRAWEGYASATNAAAAGGITTIMGMPLNSLPATTSVAAVVAEAAKAAEEGLLVDVGLWGGLVPGSAHELDELLQDPRVHGVKAFLSPLPPAAGYEAVGVAELHRAAPSIARAAVPLLVHCELMERKEMAALEATAAAMNASDSFATFLATRPRRFEARALRAVAELVGAHASLRAHVVHLSDSESLPLLRRAKAASRGRLTVETCPHYLVFAAEDVPRGETRLKCLPPIRGRANRDALWGGLDDGVIDFLASDHSPCAPSMRRLDTGDFLRAWAGISALQFSLPATWTAASARSHGIEELSEWWATAPAKMAGLARRKGSLEVGKQADFVVWNPEEEALTDRVYHRHAGSPYTASPKLKGRVRQTVVRGHTVFLDDDVHGPRVVGRDGQHELLCGRILTREEHGSIALGPY